VTSLAAGSVMAHSEKMENWPIEINDLVNPDREKWRTRLQQISIVRLHAEQGVSISLPSDMDRTFCMQLVHSAWWLGLSNIMFSKK